MIIDGKKVEASSGEVMKIIAPATNKLLDTVPNASKEDVDTAVEAALKGQKVWAACPPYQRAEILYTCLLYTSYCYQGRRYCQYRCISCHRRLFWR